MSALKKIAPLILTIYTACAIIYIGAFLMLLQISESPHVIDKDITISKKANKKIISEFKSLMERNVELEVALMVKEKNVGRLSCLFDKS